MSTNPKDDEVENLLEQFELAKNEAQREAVRVKINAIIHDCPLVLQDRVWRVAAPRSA